jgi:hypothetical protein
MAGRDEEPAYRILPQNLEVEQGLLGASLNLSEFVGT